MSKSYLDAMYWLDQAEKNGMPEVAREVRADILKETAFDMAGEILSPSPTPPAQNYYNNGQTSNVCPTCHGTGRCGYCFGGRTLFTDRVCNYCQGTGFCYICRGSGVLR